MQIVGEGWELLFNSLLLAFGVRSRYKDYARKETIDFASDGSRPDRHGSSNSGWSRFHAASWSRLHTGAWFRILPAP